MTEHPNVPSDAGDGPAAALDMLDPEVGVIDLASVAFARRLANLLLVSREQSGVSRRAMARRSAGRFTVRDLKAAEDGKRVYGPTVVGELAALYVVDLSVLLPDRLPMIILPDGIVTTGGIEIHFEPGSDDSLLMAYLRLVRTLRREQRARLIDLRRDDIEILAAALGLGAADVLDRLGALMGSSRVQRGSMATLFAAGADVVGLAAGTSVVAQRPPTTSTGEARNP